jgi:hypothetical protein
MAIRLNGWQRLWVVLSVVWAAFVVIIAWSLRPTNADVSEAEITARVRDVPDAAIRAHLTAAENKALGGQYDLLMAKFGGRSANPYQEPRESEPMPDSVSLPRELAEARSAHLSISKFARIVKATNPQLSAWDDDYLVAEVLRKWPAYRAYVDPRAISEASHRIDEQITIEKHATEVIRTIAIEALVHEKRIKMAWFAFAALAIPVSVLYALGWAIAWIRRGFSHDG